MTPQETSPQASFNFVLLFASFLFLSAAGLSAQMFRSSVVATDFDFIKTSDPSTFMCLEFKGRGPREMPDKTGPSPLIQEAFIFVAYFDDGTSVDFALDIDFGDEESARREAERYGPRLGRLPTVLRQGVKRLVVHKGNDNATAFSDIGLIVVYSDNASNRIKTHDLEETLFHESVHAAWDAAHADSPGWRLAQKKDGSFITHYARKNPDGEDLAESALFAYTILHHPRRLPEETVTKIRAAISARIGYIRNLLPPGQPIHYSVGPKYACDGSGTTFVVEWPGGVRPRAARTEAERIVCDVDLTSAGQLSDILSNALTRGLNVEAKRVRGFLKDAYLKFPDGESLLVATMAEFGYDRRTMNAMVQEYRHCNCDHEDIEDEIPFGSGAMSGKSEPETETADGGEGSPPAELKTLLSIIVALLGVLVIISSSTLVVLLKK